MKKALLLFLICILTLIMTCSCSKKMFDKYAKYEARPEKNSGILCYEYNLRKFKVTDTYITEEAQQAAIIRVRVYNESHEADDAKQSTISKRTLTKAKVLEVYFTSDDLDYELKSDDTIWLAQGFFVDRKNKILYTEMHDAELIVPGYEYLLFTIFYEQVGDNGIYKNRGVFTCPQIWTVPLDISNEEYQKILKINHFDYIEHDEICQKAIEKYINGNK